MTEVDPGLRRDDEEERASGYFKFLDHDTRSSKIDRQPDAKDQHVLQRRRILRPGAGVRLTVGPRG
jgi:hypothetical protein